MQSSELSERLARLTSDQLADLERRCVYRKAWWSFWAYAKLMAPDFYTEDRDYLRNVCETLQDFYQSEDRILVMCEGRKTGEIAIEDATQEAIMTLATRDVV